MNNEQLLEWAYSIISAHNNGYAVELKSLDKARKILKQHMNGEL